MARKKSTKSSPTERIIRLPISKLIDTKYREYAVYALESRGIPSFYDSLTPVQRYILMNTPSAFTKTLSVMGEAMGDGYHHGDMSLNKAISKLARPFGSSLRILEGYGFFGSEVSPEPAAPRYTKVKLGKKPGEILKKYSYLQERDDEGAYKPIWMDVPIGLVTGIIGLAPGYKTTILPRKLEDIKEYFEGKRKNVKPFFHDFTGQIQRYKNLDRSWIISSNINIEGNRIEVRELPPVMKYTSAIKKLDWLFNHFEGKVRVLNNSNTKVDIDVVYSGKDSKEWKEITEYVRKIFSVIVTETPVFIKDRQVLVYDKIEEYLDDYQWQLLRLDMTDKEYKMDWTDRELEFNIAKRLFIQFILQKQRTIAEVDIFLKPYNKGLKSRLEGMTSKKFTKDELKSTTERIHELESELKIITRAYKKAKILFEKTPDPTTKRGITSKRNETDLFSPEDLTEDNGIIIWDGEDPFEKKLENFEE